MDERVRELWARTSLQVWPERYVLVSLPPRLLSQAAAAVAACRGGFAALVLELEEVSLTLEETMWTASELRPWARVAGEVYKVVSFLPSLDLGVSGYFAPAAALLGEAGVAIVPQCAFLKDHVLVREVDLERALRSLESLIASCRR